MKVYIERQVSRPLEADEVRDKSLVGEVIYGEPFRVLDLTDMSPMTLSAAETYGLHFLREADPPEETPAGELTVRFRDPGDTVLDLCLRAE